MTSWDDINSIFFDKIEEDGDFFNYFNLSDEEAISLANRRADSFLCTAVAQLAQKCDSDINFIDYDKNKRVFNFEATPVEKELIASVQYEVYMSRDIAKLKVLSLNYTPSDLQVFSPNEARKSFMQMYETIKGENAAKIDAYNSRNRLSNTRKSINYISYDE